MAADTLSRLSFVNSHRGPGGRHQHDFSASSRFPPPRTQSLPHLASPAGFAPTLGNGSRQLYASLKVPYEAHLSATLHPNGTNWREPSAPRGRAAEEWVQPGRLRPETLGPAGRQQPQQRGKRIVRDNTNTLSHIGPLLYGLRDSRSDGLLRQSEAPRRRRPKTTRDASGEPPLLGPSPYATPRACRANTAHPAHLASAADQGRSGVL
ncbi:unnamed protein product [Prorocentrum cordatum]|uniref:Uncharacterized protein n=1 Tax=Prorocentrum cordatum TaxID=2364126 RepID=A0ABN9RJG3_9DINO|nr:unnamed protein product [Polarella glacialis]